MGKIVLTGGPSSGKTTVSDTIERCFAGQIVKVPEAATILFSGGFFRSTKPVGIAHQQMAIYRVQSEHENIFCLEHPDRFLICDRGTLDGYAYWPEGQGDFFHANNTTLEAELNRYDLVIHMDTANGKNYDFTNQIRTETPDEAIAINERVKKVWENHSNRVIISAGDSFATKVSEVLNLVEKFIQNN